MRGHVGDERARHHLVSAFAQHIAKILAAIALAFALMFAFNAVSAPDATAAMYPANEASAESVQTQDADDAEKSGDQAAGEEAEETIDDEENPLSSGLGGGEPIADAVSLNPIILIGILIVVVFFLVLMRRLNGSIRDMNRMFK